MPPDFCRLREPFKAIFRDNFESSESTKASTSRIPGGREFARAKSCNCANALAKQGDNTGQDIDRQNVSALGRK